MEKRLYVVLGCYGRRDEDFISCPSCHNRILQITGDLEGIDEMVTYFEGCRLYDKPLFQYDSVNHFIKNMQDRFPQGGRPLWKENKYQLYQKFIFDHRICGVFAKLEVETFNNIKKEEYKKPKFKIKKNI